MKGVLIGPRAEELRGGVTRNEKSLEPKNYRSRDLVPQN